MDRFLTCLVGSRLRSSLATGLFLGGLVVLAACSDQTARSCHSNQDCFVDESCVSGACQVTIALPDSGHIVDKDASDAAGDDAIDGGDSDSGTGGSDSGTGGSEREDVPDFDAYAPDAADPDASGQELSEFTAGCILEAPSVFSLTSSSAAIDGAMNIHVAVGGDAVRYARFDQTGWHRDIVDKGNGVALSLDADDDPILAYFDDSETRDGESVNVEKLKVARWKGGAWQIETLATLPRLAEEDNKVAVAVAADGRVFVAFLGVTTNHTRRGIELMEHDGQSWTRSTAIETMHYIQNVYVATTPDQEPLVAYHRNTYVGGYEGVVAVRSGQDWTILPSVTTASSNAPLFDFFVDADGHLAFAGMTKGGANNQHVDVYRRLNDTWAKASCQGTDSREALVATDGDGDGLVIANARYTGTGTAWSIDVTTHHADGACMSVATGGQWEREHSRRYLPDWGPLADLSSLSFVRRGQQQVILYYDAQERAIRVARHGGGGESWTLDTLWSTAIYGLAPGLVLDDDGHPVVASIEALEAAVWVSQWDGTTWHHERAPHGPGCFVPVLHEGALSVDRAPDGELRVAFAEQCGSSYHDAKIVLASRSPAGAWTRENVMTLAATYPQMRLDHLPTGHPTIAVTNGGYDVTYGVYNGTDWTLTHLPRMSGQGSRQVHGRPGLAYDTAGRPVMTWLQNNGFDLVEARQQASGDWAQVVLETARAPSNPVLRVDTSGTHHLAFIKGPSDGPSALTHGTNEGSQWTFDEAATVATPLSRTYRGHDLALDDDANPVLATHDARYGKLTLLRRHDDQWWAARHAEPGNRGWMPSLAITPEAKALVAHFHRSAGALCLEELDLP